MIRLQVRTPKESGSEHVSIPGGRSRRSILRKLVPAAAVLVIAGGCGLRGPRITVNWRKPKPRLTIGTPLRYQTVKIGQVEKVQPVQPGGGTTATIRLDPKYAHYVRTKSTFLVVVDGSGGEPVYIDLIPLDRDALPASPDAVFTGAESRLEARGQQLLTDWKRTLVLLGLAVGVLLIFVVLTKILFKLWVLVVCVGAGVAGSYWGSERLAALLAPHLPVNVPPNIIGAVAAFLLGYLAGSLLVGLLLRPFRRGKEK